MVTPVDLERVYALAWNDSPGDDHDSHSAGLAAVAAAVRAEVAAVFNAIAMAEQDREYRSKSTVTGPLWDRVVEAARKANADALPPPAPDCEECDGNGLGCEVCGGSGKVGGAPRSGGPAR